MEFWVAFAVGAGVLWLFARDQFNHPSWRDDHRLTRILSVPHLRGDRVRKRALFIYFTLLFFVYLVFVFFSSTIVSAVQHGLPDGTGGGSVKKPFALPGASVPFAVSLAMIGVAPRFELLTKLEEKIRVAAHEIMGLPRGLLSSGRMVADTKLSLDQIGRSNIDRYDLERFERHIEAARRVFGNDAARVELFERRLLKLVAYKVWVVDGFWPEADVREPYDLLESDFSTDLHACLQDLDDISAASQDDAPPEGADALRKRWSDRMTATKDLCGEICCLLFIYSEKEDPAAKAKDDAVHHSIAEFFRRATGGKSTAPDLDIAINPILGVLLIAGALGFCGVALRPFSGLSADNPGVGMLKTAVGALFLYGPAIVAAVWWNGRIPSTGFTTAQGIYTFMVCFITSLFFLVPLNVTQAILSTDVASVKINLFLFGAILSEAPMAALGAAQGVFVLKYLDLYRNGAQPEIGRKRRLIVLNVAALTALSIAATYLVVAAYNKIGEMVDPSKVPRSPAMSDFVSRVPSAALIALVIGLVLIAALSSRFADHSKPLESKEAPA